GTWGISNFWNTDPTGGPAGAFQATTTSGDDLFIDAGGTAGTITVSGTQAANSITWQTNAAIPVSGGTLINLTSALTNSTATTETISTPISWAGSSETYTTNGAGGLTTSGLTTVNTANTTFNRAGAGAGVVSLSGGLTFGANSGSTFNFAGTTSGNTSIGT